MRTKVKKFLNNADNPEKIIGKFSIDKNTMTDEGDGIIKFRGGLTITDNSEQWNGTKYDMKSFDISPYKGMLTADHRDTLQSIIGKALGIKKLPNRVSIDGIQLAIEDNPLALFAYNMMKSGYITDFSTETVGPWPDDEGIYHDAKLVGLSVVVTGNNRQARINEIAVNSITEAEKLGQDTTELKSLLKYPIDNKKDIPNNEEDMFIRIKNTRNFNVKVSFKNEKGEDEEKDLKPGETVDVSKDEADGVQGQVDKAQEPTQPTPQPAPAPQPQPNQDNNSTDALTKALNAAVAPLVQKVEDLEKKVFDSGAKEPEFVPATNSNSRNNSGVLTIKDMDYRERHGIQILAAWDMLKQGNQSAGRKLEDINKLHLEALKNAKKVQNSVTIADMGNFVISPELLTDIEGYRSDFQPLIRATNWRDTLSLSMAWLTRNGDINMQEVEFCDDGADGNLKPISEYDTTINQKSMQELAAVTPVCNAATRFLAVDLLTDVSEGYRTDYDRKKAQLVIALFQQAVNSTGNNNYWSTTTGLAGWQRTLGMLSQIAERAPNGTFVFNSSTYFELLRQAIAAGVNTEAGVGMFTTGNLPTLLGRPYIVVPNELMPSLNTTETKTFVVDGSNVTINNAIFYGDINTFTGRTSGGLNYDFSTDAAYEDGDQVKSAFQRNELVLRGSFFRGGAVRDPEKLAGMKAAGVS